MLRLSVGLLDVIAARWNSGGYCSDRCGSLATIAMPFTDLLAATTQLFEPTLASSGRSRSCSVVIRAASARIGAAHFARFTAGPRTGRTLAGTAAVGAWIAL